MSRKSLNNLDDDDLIMGPNEARAPKPKKKKVKKGIFGYPLAAKKDRILFLINNGLESDDDSSDDDSLDLNYEPEANIENIKNTSKSKQQRTPTKRALTRKSKSMTNEILINKKPRTPIKKPISAIKEEIDGSYEQSTNWSNDLPYEILLKIFLYATYTMKGDLAQLHNLRAVCKNWNSVGNDARLWHHVIISKFFPIKYTESQKPSSSIQPTNKFNIQLHAKFNSLLNKLIKTSIDGDNNNKFKFISSLDLSYLNCLTCDDLELVLRNCNSNIVHELNLSHCRKLNTSFKSLTYEKVIMDYCPYLKSLNLTKMEKQLNVNLLGNLFKLLGLNLIDLNLSQNIISVAIINSLASECKNLEYLDISNSDIKGVVNLDYMSENWPRLKRLQLLKTFPKIKYNTIESAICSPVSFTSLEELNLAFLSKFGTDPMVNLIAKLCKDTQKLKSLDIRSYRSPLNSIHNLFSMIATTHLERLYLCNSNLTEADNEYIVEAISQKWNCSLIELDLSWSNITSKALDEIINSFIRNKDNCKLRHFNLTGTCVDSTQIIKLIRSIKTIKIINLDSCRSIDRGMKKTLSTEDFADLIQ